MLENLNSKTFEYQKLSPEECESRGILGRLVGKIADCKRATRNGRLYSESLWDKVFQSDIMKEKIANRCCFGELGHPETRTEIDMEKVAICLAEQPKKGKDGFLYGIFDILATPCGKILKQLCDYGCNIGVSSRGTGDVTTDFEGNESVDPDTYDCVCWDAVLIPAVTEARMQLVTESVSTKKTLKESLETLVSEATDEDKKVMTEALNELHLDYSSEETNNTTFVSEESEVANNDGAEDLVRDYQNVLKENNRLSRTITQLQEKLSVCYAKESDYEDRVSHLQSKVKHLTVSGESTKELREQLDTLKEQYEDKCFEVKKCERTIEALKSSKKQSANDRKSLAESVATKEAQITDLQEQVTALTEEIARIKLQSQKSAKKLNEAIEANQKDSNLKEVEYSKRLTEANTLTEKYRKIARVAVDRYIESQAVRLGVKPVEIMNKLPKGYTFSDIDTICEDLQSYRVNLSKLPFDVSQKKPISVKVTESKETILPHRDNDDYDDDVDDELISLIRR